MKETPNYFAIIPANVRYDNNLKDKAKLLYGEITALSDKNGYCFANNKYFAELYDISITTVSLLIKNLIDNGYIESEIVYKENSKEIENRYLKIIKGGYLKNLKEGIKENLKDNNININNINNNNNIYNKYGTYQRIKLTDKQYNKLVEEFGKDFINKQIELLDEYIQSNNNKNKYTDFNLVIRKSIRDNWFKNNKKEGIIPEWFNKEYNSSISKEAEEFEKQVLGKNI